jgi:DNA-binding NarL/FixJ family response regulator
MRWCVQACASFWRRGRGPGWKVVGEAADGMDAVREAVALQPDVAILDYGLPLINGVDSAREIRARAPGVEILLFTMHENEELIRAAFSTGVRGYLHKSNVKQDLYAAVQSVAEHRPFFTTSLANALLRSYLSTERAEADPLTRQERLVVQLIAESRTNKETAKLLNLAVKTVETHRATAMKKLGIASVAELVRYAVRTKLVEP